MNKSKPNPLEELRQKKRQLKRNFKDDEERLLHNWDYLANNMGSLFFNTAVNGAKGMIGIKKVEEKPSVPSTESMGFLNVLSSSLPLLWEIAQPVLIGMVAKRIKRLFSSKKN